MQAHCGDHTTVMFCSSGSKALTLVVFCTSSLCWRNTPVLTATEVTPIVLVVAIAAKRRPLPICPIFVWDSVCCEAIVAESPRLLATIYTRPEQSFLCASTNHLKRRHGCRHHTRTVWRCDLRYMPTDAMSAGHGDLAHLSIGATVRHLSLGATVTSTLVNRCLARGTC